MLLAAVLANASWFSGAGSVIALRLALGFGLTVVSIRLVPLAADVVGWLFALLPLAAGPLLVPSRCFACPPHQPHDN